MKTVSFHKSGVRKAYVLEMAKNVALAKKEADSSYKNGWIHQSN